MNFWSFIVWTSMILLTAMVSIKFCDTMIEVDRTRCFTQTQHESCWRKP